jgi:hypothetical protein
MHSKKSNAKGEACGNEHTERWDCRDERQGTTVWFVKRQVFYLNSHGQQSAEQSAKLSAIIRSRG